MNFWVSIYHICLLYSVYIRWERYTTVWGEFPVSTNLGNKFFAGLKEKEATRVLLNLQVALEIRSAIAVI